MDTETHPNTNSFETALLHALDGMFLIDRSRHYVTVSDTLEKMTGFKSMDLVDKGCMCADVLQCRDEQGRRLSSVLCPANALFEGTQESARQRLQVRRRDGSELWIETIYTTVPGPNGMPEHVLGIVRDISDAKARETELMNEITTLREQLRGSGRPVQPANESAGAAAETRTMPAASGEALRLDPLLARCEREAILRALDAAHGQRNRAAQMMGISRSRLYRRMEALGVNLKDHP
jgi:PAS domain S-box-containing protein